MIRNRLRSSAATRRPARFFVEQLEDRTTPTVGVTFVNNNWMLIQDNGDGVLSVGDVVRNDLDTVKTGTITASYGVNAFGVVAQSQVVGVAAGSLAAFDSISDAVANTSTGGTVNVLDGTYTLDTPVTVNRTMTLLGAQAGVDARTRASGSVAAESVVAGTGGSFSLQANGIVLDGFTVQGTTGAPLGAGISTSSAFSGYQIRNNIIQDNTIGLFLSSNGGLQTVVEQNLVRDNDNPGAAGGTGIYSDTSISNVLIQNNRFTGANFTAGMNLIGAGASAVIDVTVAGNEFATGNQLALFNVDFSTVSGNTFSGALPGGNTGTAVFVGGGTNNLEVTGNTFTNFANRAVQVTDAGFGFGANANFTFSNNTITANINLLASGRAMIDLVGVGGTSLIANNTLTLSGTTNATVTFVDGIQIGGAGTGTVNVTGNTLNGNNVDTNADANFSAGVRLLSTLPATAVVNVLNNTITGFTHGILAQVLVAGVDVNVNFNSLAGNSILAVLNTGADGLGGAAADIDASFNWFGTAVAAEVAARVSGDVDFTPWLAVGTDTSAAPGFQPNLTILFVDDAGLQIGPDNRIQEALNLGANSTVILEAGTYTGNVIVTPGDTLAGAGTIVGVVTVTPGGTLDVGRTGITGILNTGNLDLSISATLVFDLNGTTPGTSHDQVNVTGTVDLSGATLVVRAGTGVPLGSTLVIINNDGTDAVIGTFAGLAQGATLTASNGQQFQISYTGGSGNDVVLTATTSAPPPVIDLSITKTDNAQVVNPGSTVTYTIVVSNAGNTAVVGAQVTDVVPAGLTNVTWTSTSAGGATGSAGSGSGSISETVTLPPGASITYFLTGTVSASGGGLSNTATVTTPAGVTDSNPGNNTATDVNAVLPPGVPPFTRLFAVGADGRPGGTVANGHVKVYNSDGSLRFSFFAFVGFNGGVRVATGDVNRDGVDDIVVGAGGGSSHGHVKVFDGITGAEIASFFAFEGFNGGVNVAVGDIDNDGDGDLIVGSGIGASHVKGFDFATRATLMSFFAYTNFLGGVTVAAGNFDGVGGDEIITGVATNGPAHVKVFNLSQVELASFIARANYNGGIHVAAGNLFGDGRAEIVVAPLDASGDELVQIFAGGTSALATSFTPAFPGDAAGLRVALGDVDNDGDNDILLGTGLGNGSNVRVHDGQSFAEIRNFIAFEGFNGGVFVG